MWLGETRHWLGLTNCLTGNQGNLYYKTVSREW